MTLTAHIELRAKLPAELEAIEEFCGEFIRWRVAHCPALNAFTGELLLREALANAVRHGCANDPTREVRCVLRVKPEYLLIAVSDDGPGFDWRGSHVPLPEICRADGRGIPIYRTYADRVRFNSKGNTVILLKKFTQGTL